MRGFATRFCAAFLTTTIALVPILPAPANAAELIANGGFEAVPVTHGGYVHHAGGTSFDGGRWRVLGVDVLQLDRAYSYGHPPMTFNAHGGRNSLDLTGTGNTSPLNSVYQDVTTVAGQLYRLSFWTGRATGIGTSANDYLAPTTVRLSIGGGSQLSFVNDDSIAGGLAWKQFTHEFTAAATMTRVAFFNGIGNDYVGLDDVSLSAVSAVPEPTSWMMLIGGLGLTGSVGKRLRRRRQQATTLTASPPSEVSL